MRQRRNGFRFARLKRDKTCGKHEFAAAWSEPVEAQRVVLQAKALAGALRADF
jgi:hypothetical protein